MSLTKSSSKLEKPKVSQIKVNESKPNIPKAINELEQEATKKLKSLDEAKVKYLVYGKVNSKGTRYEVTKIIEADNEDIAVSIYKERIKRDFSGIRNITCIKADLFKNGDEEYSKEIELPKAKEVELPNSPKLLINDESIEIPKDMSDVEFNYITFYIISLKLHKLKLYSCYYSPKKKINNSYRKNNILFYTSFNKLDAMCDIKNEFTSHNIEFKEKYVHELREIDVKTALNDEYIRKEMIKRAKEKFGDLEKAYEKYKDEVLSSSILKSKEDLLNA